MKKLIAVFLCCLFLLGGCQQAEDKSPAVPSVPAAESEEPSVQMGHPEAAEKGEETEILGSIFFVDWVGEEYLILSYDGQDLWRIHRFDEDLNRKDIHSVDQLDELGTLLPDSVILPDINKGQAQRKLRCSNKTWDGKLMDDTMGERYSLSPDMGTLCYNSPDKNRLIVETSDGSKSSYDFPGLVDLRCISDQLICLQILHPDHQQSSIVFDFQKGEVVAEQNTAYSPYTVISHGDLVLLRPAVNGNGDEALFRYDMTTAAFQEIPLADKAHSSNIRLGSKGHYAIAAADNILSIYDTRDFSVIAIAELEESYDPYENSFSHTVSSDGSTALIYNSSGLLQRIDAEAVVGLS